MQITSCETVAVTVNFEDVMPGTHVVLRLRTDEGIEGISYVSRVTQQTAPPLRGLIEMLVERVKGDDPTRIEALHAKLYKNALGAALSGLELRAASAVDVAAWDIRGKALNLPVHRLMGGFRDRMPVSANWRLQPGGEPYALAAHIDSLLARGFRALKCPVGYAPLDVAIKHVLFVRSCASPGVKIIVDGNFQWSLKDALHFARATEEADLYWIEDPVASHDYAGMAQITATAKQRICAGEVYQQPHEFRRLLEERCSDYVMIDQDLGLTGFQKIAHLAEVYGCPVVNHLAPEILCQALAGVPNGLIVGMVPWGQPLFVEQMQIEDGELVLPQGPGLGLTLNDEMLKRCAIV